MTRSSKSPYLTAERPFIKGYIDGYHPKMGTTGMVHVNDILMLEQNSHLITIHPDGSFYVEVPMIHPQKVYVVMPKFMRAFIWNRGKQFSIILIYRNTQNLLRIISIEVNGSGNLYSWVKVPGLIPI
jgi:hypothetical protein